MHAHGFSKNGKLRTNVAIANNAKRLATHFCASSGGLSPTTLMKQPRNIRNAAHQHDDFTNGKFNNAPRIAVRRVEYGNAVRGSGGQLHLLRTDAEAANR